MDNAHADRPGTVIFDPSLIPPEAAEYLARETLKMVRWMMTIPKYREAIEALSAARRTAAEAEKEFRVKSPEIR